MATFVLIHGAADVGWYWHLTEAELRARGHDGRYLLCRQDRVFPAAWTWSMVEDRLGITPDEIDGRRPHPCPQPAG